MWFLCRSFLHVTSEIMEGTNEVTEEEARITRQRFGVYPYASSIPTRSFAAEWIRCLQPRIAYVLADAPPRTKQKRPGFKPGRLAVRKTKS